MDTPEPAVYDADVLIRRLKRIEGQARGLQRMLEEGRGCEDVVMQLAAMREAINKVGMAVIGGYMEQCLRQDLAGGASCRASIEQAIRIFLKFA